MNEESLLYLKRADKIAKRSKDQSTKVGAFLIDEEEITPLGFGYNGMPRGLPDNDPEKNVRPEKYLWFEHAERNAIYNSAQPLMTNAIIFLSHFPNMESTRAIVSSGIQKVVVSEAELTHEHYSRVLEMLAASNVELISLADSKLPPKLLQKYAENLEFAKDYGEDLANKYSPRKEGALILNQKTFSPIAMGSSGPPPKMKISSAHIEEDGVGFWIQEAAKNAIFNAVRPKLKNSHAYVTFCPCAHCALALASVGVKRVITHQLDFTKEADLRWKDSFEKTMKILKIADIEYLAVDNTEMTKTSKSGMKR